MLHTPSAKKPIMWVVSTRILEVSLLDALNVHFVGGLAILFF